MSEGNQEATLTEVLQEQVRAERSLSERLGPYSGKWIAVRDHDIVADAETLDDLLAELGDEEYEAVFEVVEQGTACFF